MPPPSTEKIFTRNFSWAFTSNLASFCSFYLLLATLPTFILSIGLKESEIGFIIGSFAITAVLLRPFVGRFSDTHGKRTLMILGAGILALSSVLYHYIAGLFLLILLRVLHGVGWASFGTSSSALVADIAPISRRGEAMGFFGMSTNLAMSVAPAAGVAIAQYAGYGILFLLGAIIALFAMASSYLIHEDPLKRPAAPPAKGWRNFLLPSAFLPATLALLGSLSYASVVAFLPLFALQKGIGNPGLFFSVFAIILLLTRGPLGRLSDRWGRARTIIPGFFLTASSLMLLALFPAFWAMMAAAILNGLGTAASQPSLMALAVDRCGPTERGAAMGTFSTAFDLGIGTGSFAWGIIVQTAGFSVMYFVSSSVCLLAALVTFWGLSDRTNPSQ